jgi:hypothetical protein
MRQMLSRTILAICALTVTVSIATANDLGYWDGVETQGGFVEGQAGEPSVQQLAHLSEVGACCGDLPSGIAPANCGCCCDQGAGCCGQSMGCCDQGMGCCEEGFCGSDCGCAQPAGFCYAEAQLMFMRTHVSNDVVGKLSEKHELAPRFILGYEGAGGVGIRGRYWMYDEVTPNLDVPSADLGVNFDVVDIEGTTRFTTSRTDLVFAGGFRWLNAEFEVDDDSISSEMPGITFAADLRTMLCGSCESQWSGVCGARWSLLGGDWEGDSNALLVETRDDNLDVTEIYGGFEYLRRYGNCDVYARLVYEVQNWHSDALGENSATDSIGFVGPGLHLGAAF